MHTSKLITARLNIEYPIIQAPMAGVSTPQLAAAVSGAGGLGSLGLGAMTVEQAAEQIRQTRRLTGKPFSVNLFCHPPASADAGREAAWLAHLAGHFQQLGASPPTSLREIYRTSLSSEALLTMLLEERPAAVSFYFGLPATGWVETLRHAGIPTMACATSWSEAEQIERAGIDIVIA